MNEPRSVGGLKHVQILNLGGSNVIHISGLDDVTILDLSGTEVSDVSTLGKIRTLHTLIIIGLNAIDTSMLKNTVNLIH